MSYHKSFWRVASGLAFLTLISFPALGTEESCDCRCADDIDQVCYVDVPADQSPGSWCSAEGSGSTCVWGIGENRQECIGTLCTYNPQPQRKIRFSSPSLLR